MSDLLGTLDSFGRLLVDRFATLTFSTATLLAGALIVDRLVAHRARASLRIALYAPVAIRILLPLDWQIGVTEAQPVAMLFAPLMHLGVDPAGDTAPPPVASWHALAAIVYVAVAALLVGRVLVARVRLARALAAARPVPEVGGAYPVVEHGDLGPMVVGLLRPRIVLPRRLLAADDAKTLACVLRHEVAHLRRRDAWLSAAMQLLAITAWPVVPVWIAVSRVRQLVELACDEAALRGGDAIDRRRYGHALLDVAEWRSLAAVSVGAGELHFGSTLRARIEALASQRHWPLLGQAAAMTVVPLALLVACGGGTKPPAAAPHGEDTGYGYKFETDSSRAATAAPSSESIPEGPNGRISPERVQVIVRARFAAFRACYEAGLASNPKLAGTVTILSTIGKDGVTQRAIDDASTLPDRSVVSCIAGEFGKLTYPSGSGVLTVDYPIQFGP
jgi:Zn-dependent protease with chaperone function